jgi:DNA-binding MarR family transcriptional regulator
MPGTLAHGGVLKILYRRKGLVDLLSMTMGRPKLDREAAFDAIRKSPRAGWYLRNVSAMKLAVALECDRGTVAAMIDDLEAAGRVRRRRRKGRSGVLVEILDHG